jgi:hypothetical protein
MSTSIVISSFADAGYKFTEELAFFYVKVREEQGGKP